MESLNEVTDFIEDKRRNDQNGHSAEEPVDVDNQEEMVSQDTEGNSPFTDIDFDDI